MIDHWYIQRRIDDIRDRVDVRLQTVQLSVEDLKRMLSNAYERGWKDAKFE